MAIYDKASLVLIPSGTKTSKVYSQKPVNGDGDFTFSRSTAATRVNADGNIEKETQNLALQSNAFSTSPWSLQGSATLTSGQTGYDGSSDAWLLTKAADWSRLEQTISQSGVWTFSCYAKAGTLDWLSFENSGISSDTTFFNLDSGTLGTLGSGCIDSSIEDIGSGWYRCSVTISGTSAIMRIQPSISNGVVNGSNGNIYIQDAQLEQGLVARDYIETTTAAVEGGITDNVPRLDYTDSSCPALLLEPQRTNRYHHSEYIEGWATASNVTRTANYEESPEGVDNATRLQFTANGFLYTTPTQANATQYTLSCYAKRNDSGTQNVGFFRNGSGSVDSAWSLTSEWKRFTYTYTSSNTSFAGIAGLNGADVSVYGFQMEAGSYATSYIPTYGSAVTRNKDVADGAGDANLFNDSEGVLFAEVSFARDKGKSSPFKVDRISISDGTSNNRILLSNTTTSNQIQVFIRNSSGTIFNETITLTDITANNKIAVIYESGNYALYINGTEEATGTSTNVPSGLNELMFDGPSGNYEFEGKVNQIIYFPTALTDTELADLTTL